MTDKLHSVFDCYCGKEHESITYTWDGDLNQDVSEFIPSVSMPFDEAEKRGYQYSPSLDVDRPLFDLFGIDFDNDVHTRCPVCHKLVGYDTFTFTNKEFYHVTCYYQFKVKGRKK